MPSSLLRGTVKYPGYVDLASAGCSDDIAGVESPQQWPNLPDLDALWLPPAE